MTLKKLVKHHQEANYGPVPPSVGIAIAKLAHTRTLDECFELFTVVHMLTKDETALAIMTKDVVEVYTSRYMFKRTTYQGS